MCLYLIEGLVLAGGRFEPYVRCAWGLWTCDGCPIPSLRLPTDVEIELVEREDVVDPFTRQSERRGWIVKIVETDETLNRRLKEEAAFAPPPGW